ncbi:MAG: Tetratricopeptide 2 repeat protein [Chthoniobacteraceae bacterium]|nr:Tetratricopeptide 2 repeat protein [Chthoniobacteraceae bacterium]
MGALVAQGAEVAPKVIERYKQMLEKSPVEGTALDRLWSAYSDSGQTAQLIDQYRNGNRFASRMVLGLLFRKAAREEEAAAAFESASKLDEKSPLPWFALARLRNDQGRAADAAGCFEKGLGLLAAEDPQRVEMTMQLGAAWLAAGDLTKASEAWERTVTLDPSNMDLRRRLAESYVRNQLPDLALPHLEFLRKQASPPERAAALQELARLHQGAGREDKAIAALEEAIAGMAPGNWLRGELQSQLIRLHQRYRRTGELEERWKKGARENPRDIGAHLRLIEYYERVGELEQERDWLEKLVVLAPKTVDYRIRLARLLARLDDLNGAAAQYDALLKELPANADLVFERARLDVLRDALPAARERIAALLKNNDESIRQKAIEFYSENRLEDLVEEQLKADASAGAEEPMLALARFYSARKRNTDAARVLQQLALQSNAGSDPVKRAAGKAHLAQLFKEEGNPGAAIRELTEAVALQPNSREYRLLMGEFLSAENRRDEARAAFEKAYGLSRTAAEKMESDQKLFECIRGAIQVPESGAGRRRPGGGRVASRQRAPEIEEYLLILTRAAASDPSVERWLRVAQWQLWNRSVRVAQECAEQALALDPGSIEAHEFMIRLAGSEPQAPLALRHLEELIKINPAGRAGYERRAALIQLQNGATEEALMMFSQIAAANPGNVEALIDLAQAQQRAEQWDAALAVWRQVYASAPVSRKKEALGSLLRVLERLNKDAEAARLLLTQLDAQLELREQFNGFQELLVYCGKHQLLDWLRAEFERRRTIRADDYFTGMALGRILKAQGDKTGAFDLFADVSLAAPNQAEALPELVHEAEELRKGAVAVRLQSQSVRVVPQTHSDGLEKLAQLQEKMIDVEAASRTWGRVVTRFPRDPAALEHAVEFELRWGTPARAAELLRRIRTLEPGNLKALATLADLDLDSGALTEARACLEEFLAQSPAERPGNSLQIPTFKTGPTARFQSGYLSAVRKPGSGDVSRNRWIDEPIGAKSGLDLRLLMIRDLARLTALTADRAGRNSWVERWKKEALQSPSEALWALFYAGENGPLLDLLMTLMDRPELQAPVRQAFVWLALQTGEFDRLAAWLHDPGRTYFDRDYLFGAGGAGGSGWVGWSGGSGWREGSGWTAPGPGGLTGTIPGGVGLVAMAIGGVEGRESVLLEKLFSDHYRLRRWQAAIAFANRARFKEAVQLGTPIFEQAISLRAGYGLELAQWHIYLGQIDAARRVLSDSMSVPGDSLEAPVYHVIREFYLLLPKGERAEFVRQFLGALDPIGQPLHSTLCGVLLHGLAGETETAHGELQKLLALQPLWSPSETTPDDAVSRYWSFVLSTGAQLQQWQLDPLAIFYWDKALGDAAEVRLQQVTQQPGQVHARLVEIRTRLAALRITRADSEQEVKAIVTEYSRYAGVEGLAPLAESLENAGAYARSIAIYRQIWEREPSSPHTLRDILSACRTGNDSDTLVTVLGRCVREGFYRMNDATHNDLILQWVDALVARRESIEAVRVLERAIAEKVSDPRLAIRLAQLQSGTGNAALAESTYRGLLTADSVNPPVRMALAALLEGQSRWSEAIEVLEKSTGPEADTRLAMLYLKADKMEDAFAALERLPAAYKISATLLFADGLIQKGELKAARSLLCNALSRNTVDGRTAFPLQAKFIELLGPADDRSVIARELRRLRRMTGNDPELFAGYFDFVRGQSQRLAWGAELDDELARDWNDGALVAGAMLIEMRLAQNDLPAVRTLWAGLLSRADMTEPVMQRLAAVFAKSGESALATAALERLARLVPLDPGRMLEWARRAGAGQAGDVLEELAARSVLNADVAGQVAQAFVERGEMERALPLFKQCISADPVARNFRLYLDFARLHRVNGDFAEAKELLRTAFGNPLNRECGEIVEFLAAQGMLDDRFESELSEFALDTQRLASTRQALFTHLEKEGAHAPALALAEAYPEMADALLCKRLRLLCKTDFERLAVLFEKVSAISGDPLGVQGELAALFCDWADSALSNDATALEPLRRGHGLLPNHFGIAQRLSQALLAQGKAEAAIAVLEEFVAASPVAAEKAKAAELLSKIPR